MLCTIYLLRNNVNGKIYIGQTWLPLKLRMGHNGSNYKNSIYLYSAIQKYGAAKFTYQTLAFCETQEKADKTEDLFISIYNSRNNQIGYNLKEGGSAGRHSSETKVKIAESIRNKEWSPEALFNRAKAGRLWKGKKRGPQNEERKQHTIEMMKEWHANNDHPMLGKRHSEEAIQKMSEATKKQWESGAHSEESIKQRSVKRMMDFDREQAILQSYQDGKVITEIEEMFQTGRSSIYRILKRNNITKERDRNNWSGKTHSEETKRKMAEARTKYWASKE